MYEDIQMLKSEAKKGNFIAKIWLEGISNLTDAELSDLEKEYQGEFRLVLL